MATPFIGEIRLFAFSQVPKNWQVCDGSILQISQNQALFAVLGVTYGGNGSSTFALPDLRGRSPMSSGQGTNLQNYPIGTKAGSATVALAAAQGPPHTHSVMAIPATATTSAPANNMLATTQAAAYGGTGGLTPMNAAEVSTVGGQPHVNMQPSLVMAYCIALTGIFPVRS